MQPIPLGLGAKTEECTYFLSDDACNFGGGGFCAAGSPTNLKTRTLPMISVTDALKRFEIADIDIIKIDVEGAEHDILAGMPEDVLGNVKVIVGELHHDEARLLDFLATWFQVTPKHRKGRPTWFCAVNRQLKPE